MPAAPDPACAEGLNRPETQPHAVCGYARLRPSECCALYAHGWSVRCCAVSFKTAAINHSATAPSRILRGGARLSDRGRSGAARW